jgi:hypothetical protein
VCPYPLSGQNPRYDSKAGLNLLGLDYYDLEVPAEPLTKTDLRVRLVRVHDGLCVQCDVNPARRKYCSGACRQMAYRRRNSTDKKCEHCQVNPARQRFCGDDCRKAWYSARRLDRRNRWVVNAETQLGRTLNALL